MKPKFDNMQKVMIKIVTEKNSGIQTRDSYITTKRADIKDYEGETGTIIKAYSHTTGSFTSGRDSIEITSIYDVKLDRRDVVLEGVHEVWLELSGSPLITVTTNSMTRS